MRVSWSSCQRRNEPLSYGAATEEVVGDEAPWSSRQKGGINQCYMAGDVYRCQEIVLIVCILQTTRLVQAVGLQLFMVSLGHPMPEMLTVQVCQPGYDSGPLGTAETHSLVEAHAWRPSWVKLDHIRSYGINVRLLLQRQWALCSDFGNVATAVPQTPASPHFT